MPATTLSLSPLCSVSTICLAVVQGSRMEGGRRSGRREERVEFRWDRSLSRSALPTKSTRSTLFGRTNFKRKSSSRTDSTKKIIFTCFGEKEGRSNPDPGRSIAAKSRKISSCPFLEGDAIVTDFKLENILDLLGLLSRGAGKVNFRFRWRRLFWHLLFLFFACKQFYALLGHILATIYSTVFSPHLHKY